jgi:phage terminase large subunit-like protein
MAQADRAVSFFSTHLKHTKGRRFVGQPFDLAPWQAIDVREVFGRVNEEGYRVVRVVYIAIPKKNGKSELGAGIALKLLFADDEPGAEVYGAAADRGQASIVFNVASQMVGLDDVLTGASKVLAGGKRIVVPDWHNYYQAISSEVAGKHGYNSHGVVFDELHAQKDRRLWEVLTFGAGAARTQPLVWGMTTAGIPGESPVAEELHELADKVLRGIIPCPPDFYCVIYEAPDDMPWDSEETWRYCNPALGSLEDVKAGKAFLAVESVRADEYSRAKRSSSDKQSFLRLRLNRWVQQLTRWIEMDDWDACGKLDSADPVGEYKRWEAETIRELKGMPCYVGLDLSTKLDITAAVLVWRDGYNNIHWLPYFWIPLDNLSDRPNLESHKYKEWVEQGFLNATVGNSVEFAAVREKLIALREHVTIKEIVFDPKFATQLSQELEGAGFTCVEFHQGYANYTEPCSELESALKDRRLRHGGHPMLRWMADCVEVAQRGDGALRPVKPDRARASKRIDGIVGGLMGLSGAILRPGAGQSIYNNADTAVM